MVGCVEADGGTYEGQFGIDFPADVGPVGGGPDCPDGGGLTGHGGPVVVLADPFVEFEFPRAACGDVKMLLACAVWPGEDGAGGDVEGYEGAAVFDDGSRDRGPDFVCPELAEYNVVARGPAKCANFRGRQGVLPSIIS